VLLVSGFCGHHLLNGASFAVGCLLVVSVGIICSMGHHLLLGVGCLLVVSVGIYLLYRASFAGGCWLLVNVLLAVGCRRWLSRRCASSLVPSARNGASVLSIALLQLMQAAFLCESF